MDVKYIYNEKGEREAVIIPISEWRKIKHSLEQKSMSSSELKKYAGSITLDADPLSYQKAIRDEWE